jgi:hypothetical protein
MSSNDIFVPFLDLCRFVETDYAIRQTFHQTEALIAGFGRRTVKPRQPNTGWNAASHGVTTLMLLDASQPIWVVA